MYINIEMNKDYYEGLFIKNTAYVQKIATTIYNTREDFSNENKIYQINFDNFDHFGDNQEIYEFLMKEKTTNRIKDEKMIGLYNTEKLEQQIKNIQINNARKEGIKQGIEQEKINTAKTMLKENIDINTISKVTKLNTKYIKNLITK